MLMRTRPRQWPKVVTFQPRRGPVGWPNGVRPEVPSMPDCLKNKFVAHVNEEEECKYLDPMQHHVCEEPREKREPAYGSAYEPDYEPVENMENPE